MAAPSYVLNVFGKHPNMFASRSVRKVFNDALKDNLKRGFVNDTNKNIYKEVTKTFGPTEDNKYITSVRDEVTKDYEREMRSRNQVAVGRVLNELKKSTTYVIVQFEDVQNELTVSIGNPEKVKNTDTPLYRYDKVMSRRQKYSMQDLKNLTRWAVIKFNVKPVHAENIAKKIINAENRRLSNRVVFEKDSPYGSRPVRTERYLTRMRVLYNYSAIANQRLSDLIEQIILDNFDEIFNQ